MWPMDGTRQNVRGVPKVRREAGRADLLDLTDPARLSPSGREIFHDLFETPTRGGVRDRAGPRPFWL